MNYFALQTLFLFQSRSNIVLVFETNTYQMILPSYITEKYQEFKGSDWIK